MEAKSLNIRRLEGISGGRSPWVMVADFLVAIGGDPDCLLERSNLALKCWEIVTREGYKFKIEFNSAAKACDVVFSLYTPICSVPLRCATETLAVCLEQARSLMGCKVVLIDYEIHLGCSLSGEIMTPEQLRYHYDLLNVQRDLFFSAIQIELGLPGGTGFQPV